MNNTENDYLPTDLGNVSLNPRGEYDPETAYEYLDTVSYQGGSYVCRIENGTTITGTAPDPGRNTDIWQMLTLPGNLRPDYIAMHDDVVNKAAQVEISRAAVEQAQQEVEAAQADVQQLHEDTVQTAQEAENSRDSAAGYAQSAEASRKAAAESEQNINAKMTDLDQKVSKSVTQAIGDIAAARQQAIGTVTTQETKSAAEVKRVGAAALDSAEQALQKINTAGQQAVRAVTNQQNISIQAVKDETKNYIEEKKQEISAKTDEVTQAVNQAGEVQLQNIANSLDNTLTESGKAADAGAVGDALYQLSIIESASGSEIVINDSAEMPLKGLHIYGKSTQVTTTGAQLLKYPYANNDDNYDFPGIIVKACDGHIKMTGITTEGGNFYLMRNVPPGAYGLKVSNSFKGVNLLAYDYVNKKVVAQISANTGLKQTFTVTEEAKVGIYFNVSNAGVTVDVDVDVLLTKAENIDTALFESYSAGYPSPSPDYPQEIKSMTNPAMKVSGKNLLGGKVFADKIVELGGTLNEADKTVKIPGSIIVNKTVFEFPDSSKQYTIILMGKNTNTSLQSVNLKADKSSTLNCFQNGRSITVLPTGNTKVLGNYDTQIVIFNYEQCGIFEGVLTYDEFEIYHKQTAIFPYILNAIPVDYGGNYTDSAGQRWICDELDFKRGVYVQRILKVEINDKSAWTVYNAKGYEGFVVDELLPTKMLRRSGFSNQYNISTALNTNESIWLGVNNCRIYLNNNRFYDDTVEDRGLGKLKTYLAGHPLVIMTYLDTPIETPLTEDQIVSYKALHTYNGTTIIESEADLSLSYVANPKKYIDKKFAELSQAIIASASEAE